MDILGAGALNRYGRLKEAEPPNREGDHLEIYPEVKIRFEKEVVSPFIIQFSETFR